MNPYRTAAPSSPPPLRFIILEPGSLIPNEFDTNLNYETYDFVKSLWRPAKWFASRPVVEMFNPALPPSLDPWPELLFILRFARERMLALLNDLALKDGPILGFTYRGTTLFGALRSSPRATPTEPAPRGTSEAKLAR